MWQSRLGNDFCAANQKGPWVLIAAIIIADSQARKDETDTCGVPASANWACVDLLGQSVIGRVADDLKGVGIDSVSVFAAQHSSLTAYRVDGQSAAPDRWRAAAIRFAKCKEEAFEAVLVADCSTYAEFDLADMLAFHRERDEPVTQAYCADGSIDLWMIDPSCFDEGENLRSAILAVNPACYEIRGYVNRLRNVRDFRRLVLDSFSSRSRLRPRGIETRPGVWISENAEVGRNVRIVPPAFIGRGVRIADECLITRSTNVERGSHVDFGTAVEDSSVLPNTYLGIGLDLSHSITEGKTLWNLRHDVTLEITDPSVMRPNPSSGEEHRHWEDFNNRALNLFAQGISR